MREKILKYIREQRLLQAGERIAVAVSGGADSVALLRLMLELGEDLGIVLSVAHFHHRIRGSEADADQQFVVELARKLSLELHSGSADVPAYARDHKLSLESAARELRHRWFGELVENRKADKIATAHTLDDQAETVLMRIIRGTGVRGLAGIAPEQRQKHLVRPFLGVTRREIEAYLHFLNQKWRSDSSNQNLTHTRNRIRHLLLPMLEKEFNPSIRQTLGELAEVSQLEDEYWKSRLDSVLPRLIQHGIPSRSGRSVTGKGSKTLGVDRQALQKLPLATQAMVLSAVAQQLGVALEFNHIQSITGVLQRQNRPARLPLHKGLSVTVTPRELRFSLELEPAPVSYLYSLPIPGAVRLPELGKILQARVITAGKQKISGYNAASLLNRTLLAPELTIRNWRAGDRFFPAHSRSPKKVKELLQPGRLGSRFSIAERKLWPVAESAGEIVWMRGFPVAQAFAVHDGEAVLIEEIDDDS